MMNTPSSVSQDDDQDDFSRRAVPLSNTLSGVHIGLVIVGGTIGIPVYLMSAKLGSSLGLAQALPAFALGCFILGILGALTSLCGSSTHLSTYRLVEFAFGRSGAKLVNLIIALSLIGWYSVTMNVFAQAMDSMVFDLSGISLHKAWYIVLGSALMCGITISGFKGIDILAILLVPIMLLFLIYAAVLAFNSSGDGTLWPSRGEHLSFSAAVFAVIGSYIVGVVIQPDYSRFAKNNRQAMAAVFIALGVSFPIVMLLCAIPGMATGEQDLIKIMLLLGIGAPAFALLVLGSWSSNVLSLYSSSLSAATIFTRAHLWQIIAVIAVLGTALAFLNMQEYLLGFLLLLGVSIPPIASIYSIEVLLFRRSRCDVDVLDREPRVNIIAFVAWLSASGFGFMVQQDIVAISSRIAAIDSILVSLVVYASLGFVTGRSTSNKPQALSK
jgi:cytosine permease